MKKLMSMMTLLLLLVALVVPASAQMPKAFCGDLSEADCAIFTAASESMLKQESASVAMNLDVNVSNIPDAPFNSLAFNLAGQGAYHIEPGLLEKYAALQSDPAALLKDMSQLGTMVSDVFNSFDGQMSLTLTLPDEVVKMAAQNKATIPNKLSVELRMVNGVGYINLSSLAESLPKEAGIPSGWYGLEIAKLMKNLMDITASQMKGMDMPEIDASAYSQFTDPAFLGSFMKVERLADSNGAAVFQMTMNLVALADSPAFANMIKQQVEASGQKLTEADMKQAIEMVKKMYEGLDMKALYTINLADSTIRRMEMTMNWDLASMMSAVGESSAKAPVINVAFSADYSDLNAAPAITAPEKATVITAEQAMQMFMGGMTSPEQVTPEATPGM